MALGKLAKIHLVPIHKKAAKRGLRYLTFCYSRPIDTLLRFASCIMIHCQAVLEYEDLPSNSSSAFVIVYPTQSDYFFTQPRRLSCITRYEPT